MSQPVMQSSAVRDAAMAELIDRLTARVKAGESLDLEAVLREHPEHADELRRLLPAVQLLADLPPSADTVASSRSVNSCGGSSCSRMIFRTSWNSGEAGAASCAR